MPGRRSDSRAVPLFTKRAASERERAAGSVRRRLLQVTAAAMASATVFLPRMGTFFGVSAASRGISLANWPVSPSSFFQADEFDFQSSDHGGLGRIAKLRDSGFEFVLIGGCAALTFGSAQVARYFDICVVLTGENVERLRRVLAEWNPAVAGRRSGCRL